jgi:hypothetical protein
MIRKMDIVPQYKRKLGSCGNDDISCMTQIRRPKLFKLFFFWVAPEKNPLL